MSFLKEYNKFKIFLLKKENIFLLVFIVLIFYLDRYSKTQIINNFIENSFFINDYINLDLIWNTGIGFGLFNSNEPLVYNFFTIFIAIAILVLLYVAIISNKSEKIIFSIIIGGALGNFYDRLFYNAVPDFIDLHYGSFHWFTFNVADIFITIGIVMFLIWGIKKR